MDPIVLELRTDRSPPASAPVGGELSAEELDGNFSNLKAAAEQLDSEKAAVSHTHSIANVTGLQSALDGKASTDAFTSGAAGLVPASGGGTENFLRADGTFAEPPGGAGISDGDKGDITVSSSGAAWAINNGAVDDAAVAAGLDATKLADGSVSNAEFQRLNGVTEDIQTQLDGKLSAASASEITDTKAVPVDADELILRDSAASNAAKLTTVGGVRTRLGNQPVGAGLGTTGSVALDLAVLTGTIQTITATGDLTFTTSNRAAGRAFELRIAAGGSTRTLTWPAWVPFGAALPTTLESGTSLRVAISCLGSADTDIDAAAAVSV